MDFSALTYLDYGVLAIIGVSTLFAFFRGFIGSLLSLIGWVAAIYLSYELYPDFKPFLASKISSEIILLMAGHSILLTMLLIAFAIFNAIIGSVLKKFTNGALDKILGLGFGALRGGLILSFFFMMLATSMVILKKGDNDGSKKSEDDILPKFVTESQTYPYLKTGRDVLADFIPQSFNERAKQAINSVTDKSNQERFYSNAVKMIQENITDEQLEAVMGSTKDDYKNLSKEESEKHKLQELMKLYKQNKGTGDIEKDKEISDDDIQKIEKLLQDFSATEKTDGDN